MILIIQSNDIREWFCEKPSNDEYVFGEICVFFLFGIEMNNGVYDMEPKWLLPSCHLPGMWMFYKRNEKLDND